MFENEHHHQQQLIFRNQSLQPTHSTTRDPHPPRASYGRAHTCSRIFSLTHSTAHHITDQTGGEETAELGVALYLMR
jgi:hypothetical protein